MSNTCQAEPRPTDYIFFHPDYGNRTSPVTLRCTGFSADTHRLRTDSSCCDRSRAGAAFASVKFAFAKIEAPSIKLISKSEIKNQRLAKAGGEGVARSDVSEAHQGMRTSCRGWSSLSPAIRLPLRSTVGQVMQLTSVDKAFQDVLLDVTVVIANGREPVTELREVFDRLSDPIIGHVIGSRLGAQAQVTALRSVTARFLP
jgi:hypothetical protein